MAQLQRLQNLAALLTFAVVCIKIVFRETRSWGAKLRYGVCRICFAKYVQAVLCLNENHGLGKGVWLGRVDAWRVVVGVILGRHRPEVR